MKEIFKYFKTDKIVKWSTIIALILIFFETVYITFYYFSLPPFIPIFNQLPWGEERLGTKIEIFFPVVISIVFSIFNFFLLNQLYEKMPLASRMLSITTILITILSFIFSMQTLHLIL